MHIKSIHLDGFKSYQKHTDILDFSPTFNAITGEYSFVLKTNSLKNFNFSIKYSIIIVLFQDTMVVENPIFSIRSASLWESISSIISEQVCGSFSSQNYFVVIVILTRFRTEKAQDQSSIIFLAKIF